MVMFDGNLSVYRVYSCTRPGKRLQFTVCELEAMAQSKLLIYPAMKWWIFPYMYIDVLIGGLEQNFVVSIGNKNPN